MTAPRPRIAPGTLLDGKWRVEEPLGEGGVGVVYSARHARNNRAVAIKVLHGEVARDQTLRKRFLQEGYAANRVGHPGAVQVVDDGATPEGWVYLVMERLDGSSLEALATAAGGTLRLSDVLRWTLSWLDVVAAAHAVGIIHRDLKPENVMLLADGRIKVLDFGLARVHEGKKGHARLTTNDSPMGTPAFMPPEQALAKWDQVSARSDVYSVGASMFTLLTGHIVHEATSIPELMVKVCTQPVRPIRSVEPRIPASVARVIDRALAHDPAQRYADAREMLTDLKRAAAEVTEIFDGPTEPDGDGPRPIQPWERATTKQAPPPSEARGQLRERRLRGLRIWLAATALGCLAIGAVGLAMMSPEGRDREPATSSSARTSAASRLEPAPSAPDLEEPVVTPSAPGTAAPSAPASAPASAAAPPGAQRPRPPATTPPPKRCRYDEFAMRCPCARCD